MATSGGEELFAACHALFGVLWLIPPVLLRGSVRVFEPPAPLPLAFARYALRSVVNKHSLKRRVFSTTLTPPRSLRCFALRLEVPMGSSSAATNR